jgi:hypothetical protein
VTRSRIVSLTLLGLGTVCIVAGVFGLFGLFVALIVLGVLLVAADLLVPNR